MTRPAAAGHEGLSEQRYRVIVEQIVPDDKLVPEDRRSNPAGRYLYAAGDKQQALHRFRQEIPIVRGDDFTVEVEDFHEATTGM